MLPKDVPHIRGHADLPCSPAEIRVGFVVIAMWPDGRSEQLVGFYREARHAQRWIDERGGEWRRAHDPNRDGAGRLSR
jgi:hypothetical protein